MIKSQDIRQQFIDFFKEKEHTFVRSSSVVPHDDPTLLFTNAGMNQFKPIFLNQEEPKSLRAVNSQKCIRVSGKHNDLEEVGVDNYHHTFFEMLGNWSFGDYYKEEAIKWAWELLTEVWGIDKKRLWVTIFKDDDEADEIWTKVTDINKDRVLKFGHKDNFWEMGDTGPCGPCTEIHYYTGDNPDGQHADGVNIDAEYREIWNLVFIQYDRNADGSLTDLPSKHVDTGAGFERLVAILNGYTSNYETDLFQPLIKDIEIKTGKDQSFENGVPHQVIADHLRMLSFSIADGAMPGNEGQGYVLRRVLRRASRFARLLGMKDPFIYSIVPTLVEVMGEAFPELKEKQSFIEKVIRAEEKSFCETLDRGLEKFNQFTRSIKKKGVIPGERAFELYDTFGFPVDLTELMAREIDLTVDLNKFNECMNEQRTRAQASGKFIMDSENIDWTILSSGNSSEFIGYKKTQFTSIIRKYRHIGEYTEVILDKTPFYAESGGQVGDTGKLKAGEFEFTVKDTQQNNNEISHLGQIVKGDISKVNEVDAIINEDQRQKTRLNHTATHLMHQAMKKVLGDHVQQSGSLVEPNRLRFDLTHFEKIKKEEIQKIEQTVNLKIRENIKVNTEIKDFEKARSEGATALFGEKYGDVVRVVDISGFSKELCGGTHVNRTGDIGAFKIISESSLSAGIRRIEAVTGAGIIELLESQDKIINEFKSQLKCSDIELTEKLRSLIDERKQLDKEIQKYITVSQGGLVSELIEDAEIYKNIKIVVKRVDEIDNLKDSGDQFRNNFKTMGIALIGSIQNGKPMVMCSITDDLTSDLHAGNIVKEVGASMGGGGGGKPHLATAGGNDISLLNDALNKGFEYIKSLIK